MSKNSIGAWLLCCVIFITACCTSEQSTNHASSEQSSSNLRPQTNRSSAPTNATPSRSQNDSVFSELDNQMSVAELRARLDEVKAIEQEARRMVALRQNWEIGTADCMEIMRRLKPRADAIRDEYKRMLSPAGIEIANAAINLIGCIHCIENAEDDCGLARQAIRNAERELKKEERQGSVRARQPYSRVTQPASRSPHEHLLLQILGRRGRVRVHARRRVMSGVGRFFITGNGHFITKVFPPGGGPYKSVWMAVDSA